jgi:hypothetical protein
MTWNSMTGNGWNWELVDRKGLRRQLQQIGSKWFYALIRIQIRPLLANNDRGAPCNYSPCALKRVPI